MKIVSLVTQKGGSGKTTLCLNLAVAAALSNKKVLIVDLDPQQTAYDWYQEREERTPLLINPDINQINNVIEKARHNGVEYLFIDTKGHDNPNIAKVMGCSDFCIIPCRPTKADMRAVVTTQATLRRLNKPGCFVLVQTPSKGFRIKDSAKGLGVAGLVCPHHISYLVDYQDAYGNGLGVVEFNQEGKAAAEIRQVWSWLDKKIDKDREQNNDN